MNASDPEKKIKADPPRALNFKAQRGWKFTRHLRSLCDKNFCLDGQFFKTVQENDCPRDFSSLKMRVG